MEEASLKKRCSNFGSFGGGVAAQYYQSLLARLCFYVKKRCSGSERLAWRFIFDWIGSLDVVES